MLSRVTSMLAFGLAGLSHLSMGDQVQNPVRLRLNSDIITTLFHKGDQRILDAFQDIQTSAAEDEEGSILGQLNFSLDTKEGVEKEDYDFHVGLYDKDDFLGFQGKDLRVHGKATMADGVTQFDFEVPIDLIQMEVTWIKEDDPKILEVNKKAERPFFNDVELKLGTPVLGDGAIGN